MVSHIIFNNLFINMANPWTLKQRVFWKDDVEFNKFNNKLYNEMWTFEETLKISTLENCNFKGDKKQILETIKNKWLEYVSEWNDEEDMDNKNKTKGFVALTFLFIVIPYNELDDIGKYFTNFEVNNISTCYFYNTSKYLNFVNIDDLFKNGPMFPPAYREWLNDRYDNAAWWLSYMTYEKNNGLKPIIDSEPAKLKLTCT